MGDLPFLRLAFRIASTKCTSEVHLRKRVALVISLFGGGLKAETVGEKSGERIPCLRTSRQRARMVVHGRCMRACTGLVQSVLGRESKSDVLVMRRNAASLGAPGLPGSGPAQRMRRTMLACACNTATPVPAPKCTRQRVPECVYTLKSQCIGCLPASPALISLT